MDGSNDKISISINLDGGSLPTSALFQLLGIPNNDGQARNDIIEQCALIADSAQTVGQTDPISEAARAIAREIRLLKT